MKRRIVIVLIFLLAGALVNLAVAWALAIRVTPVSPLTTVPTYEGVYEGTDESQWWWCQVVVRPGHEQVVWERAWVMTSKNVRSDLLSSWRSRRMSDWLKSRGLTDPAGWPNAPTGLRPSLGELRDIQDEPPARIDEESIPSWAGRPPSIKSGGRVRRAFGWPTVAMWHEEHLAKNFAVQAVAPGGLGFANGFQFLGPGRVLPCGIIVRGFAVNTLLYAVVLWLLIPGPFVLRRFIRRRRGRCPGCGYPVGGSEVCSECGMALALARPGGDP